MCRSLLVFRRPRLQKVKLTVDSLLKDTGIRCYLFSPDLNTSHSPLLRPVVQRVETERNQRGPIRCKGYVRYLVHGVRYPFYTRDSVFFTVFPNPNSLTRECIFLIKFYFFELRFYKPPTKKKLFLFPVGVFSSGITL